VHHKLTILSHYNQHQHSNVFTVYAPSNMKCNEFSNFLYFAKRAYVINSTKCSYTVHYKPTHTHTHTRVHMLMLYNITSYIATQHYMLKYSKFRRGYYIRGYKLSDDDQDSLASIWWSTCYAVYLGNEVTNSLLQCFFIWSQLRFLAILIAHVI